MTLTQASGNPSAALLLTCWLVPPLSHSLQKKSRDLLFKKLPVIIKAVPTAKLTVFLQTAYEAKISSDGGSSIDSTSVCDSLHGLKMALAVPDPPQNVMMV